MPPRPRLASRRAAAAALAAIAAALLSGPAAAEAPPAPEPPAWRSTGTVASRLTLPPGRRARPGPDGDPPPVVFVLPDEAWDPRRAHPYLDRLSLGGVAVLELWAGDDGDFGVAEARDAMASAIEELRIDPSRVALLGFGAGGRLALALAGPHRPAAALYPACQGAPVPHAAARVMVLHPDEASEARGCAELVGGSETKSSGRVSPGAGHGWDVVGEPLDRYETLLPHPGAPRTLSRRLRARSDARATRRAVEAVAGFILGGADADVAPRETPQPAIGGGAPAQGGPAPPRSCAAHRTDFALPAAASSCGADHHRRP
jgi:hypothetical protein